MKKHRSIPDKDKLFRKLFISPSYFSNIQPPILVSPDFLTLLLEQSTHACKQEQKELLQEILRIFVQRPTNSILLSHSDRVSRKEIEKSIMDLLVMRIVVLVESEEDVHIMRLYLNQVSLMLAYYRVGLKNITKLTQFLSKQNFIEKFDSIKMLVVVKLLKIYYARKLGVQNAPNRYFYLLGSENCGIQPVNHNAEEMHFKNELNFTITFNSQGTVPLEASDPTSNPKSNLLYLQTEQKEQIFINLSHHKVTFVILSKSKFLDEIIAYEDVSDQVWHRLVVNLTHTHTECQLDHQEKKFRPLLKKEKQRKIRDCIFGKQFFGMIGSVMLSSKNWPLERLPVSQFPYSVESWESLEAFHKTNLSPSVIVSCFPFSTFEVRGYLHCFDIFRRNHSSVSENVIVMSEPISQEKLSNLGGIKMVLPLFYLLRFYRGSLCAKILEQLLQLLLQILKTFANEEIVESCHHQNFIQILGLHLHDIPSLQTPKSMKILEQIYKHLKHDSLKIKFIKNVLWNLNIPMMGHGQGKEELEQIEGRDEVVEDLRKAAKSCLSPRRKTRGEESEGRVLREYYTLLLKIYENEKGTAMKSLDFEQIAYWMVHSLESSQGVIYSCCLQHYLNESVLSEEINIREMGRLMGRSKDHFSYVEIILSNLLENTIILAQSRPSQQSLDCLKVLLRLVLQKYSPCLYLTVLNIIHKQISIFKKQIVPTLNHHDLDILSFLIFLSEKSINPDIIVQIVYISLYLAKHTDSHKREEFITFVQHLFRINIDLFKIQKQSPIRNAAKKLRKNSFPTSSSTPTPTPTLNRSQSMPSLGSENHGQRWEEIERKQIVKAIRKCPEIQRLCCDERLLNLSLNFLSHQVSWEDEPNENNNITNERGIGVMSQYYQLCNAVFKEKVLLYILAVIEKHPRIRDIPDLNMFLLHNLIQVAEAGMRKGVMSEGQIWRQESEFSFQQTTLIAIYSCIFSHIISSTSSITAYYCSLKCVKAARPAVSSMFVKAISKVIKLMDLRQLCQILSICKYQQIETTARINTELQDLIMQVLNHMNKLMDQEVRGIMGMDAGGGTLMQIVDALRGDISCEHKREWLAKITALPLFSTESEESVSYAKLQKSKSVKQKQNQNQKEKLKEKLNSVRKPMKISKILLKINKLVEQKKMEEISSILVHKIINEDEAEECEIAVGGEGDGVMVEECSEADMERDVQEINQARKIMEQHQSEQASTLPSPINFSYQKYQLSNLELYLLFLFHSPPPEELRQESLAVIQIYCLTLQNREITEDEKENVLHLIYLFMYHCCDKQDLLEKFLLFLFQEFIKEGKGDSSSSFQSMRMEQVEGTQFESIFEQIWHKYLKINTREETEELKKSSIAEARKKIQQQQPRIKQIFQHMQNFFISFNDQNDLLIVEKYQTQMDAHLTQYEQQPPDKENTKLRSIHKLFDLENSLEEKSRIKFLYQSECEFRKYHAEWDRIWTKLQTYHEGYGLWMAQRGSEGSFVYEQKQQRNFKFEMSEYPNNINITPILEAKILPLWHTIKDNKTKQNKYINSFTNLMRPSHVHKTKKSEQISFLSYLFWRTGKKSESSSSGKQYETVWICRSNKAEGKLFIQNKEELIFCYDSVRQDDSHISFQKFSLPYNRETYQKWNLFKIEKIRVHRYLLKYNALEITMASGLSYIFNFVNEDKEEFMRELEKIQKEKILLYGLKLLKMNKLSFFSQRIMDTGYSLDAKIVDKWKKREISNLEYLVHLNKVASRGIFDLSQYYVLPWIADLSDEKEPKLRDLSKTMGGLGSEERRAIVKEKYETHDPFNPHPPFFYGTHYSSPGVVFNFLIRLSPFTEYCKHLQGGKFDIADRLFSSLVNSWRSATEEVSDVRELIPQFYYLPEILINLDEYNFGITQTNERVNNVEIPKWSAHNPYFFVSQMRMLLESEEVSQHLNEWIDLIFGFKQKGKQAEENLNIYYYLTYEENADLDNEEEEIYRKSKESQIVHFGQTPPMIFDKPHPKRNPSAVKNMHQLHFTQKIKLHNCLKEKPITIKIQNNQMLILKRNQLQFYSLLSSPASLQKKKKLNIERDRNYQLYFMLKKERSHAEFLTKNYIVLWGYLNNEIRVINWNTAEVDAFAQLESRVTRVFINEDENMVLVGLASGLLVVFEIEYASNNIFMKRVGEESFPAEVSHIDNYDGFYSIAFGNYVAVYKIERTLHYLSSSQEHLNTYSSKIFKFFRSFHNPLSVRASFILSSPLFSLIIIDNANIKSYSINGQFMRGVSSNSANGKIYGRFKDHQLHDVFYTVEQDRVICYSVPDLRSVSILELPDDYEYIADNCFTMSDRRNEIWNFGYGEIKDQ